MPNQQRQPGGRPARKHFDTAAWAADFHALRQFLNLYAWPIVICTGVCLRIFGIFCARWFWLDESMLLTNVREGSVFRVVGPLKQEQVAPPGFLMILRAIHATCGLNVIPLRFPAFVAGTAAFVLFALWARRFLPRKVGLIAAWLMAVNADALYYCQEMKPYAFDLLATVVIMILIDRLTRHDSADGHPDVDSNFSRRWKTAAFLVWIPWFSIASVFPVTAFLILTLVRHRGDRKAIVASLPVVICWAISFLVAWGVEKSQVIEGSVLWNFWDFAFLKPLRPVDSLCVLADNFINPLHFATSFDSPWIMFPWITVLTCLMLYGLRNMYRKMPWLACFVSATTALVAAASVARFYPFHGRTIVVLLPCALTVFSFGLAHLPIRGKLARQSLIALALTAPSLSAVHIRPFSDGRLISFDGDLEYDHFSPRYGVVKRANTPPPRLTAPKSNDEMQTHE